MDDADEVDREDDMHYCLKCHTTVSGLDNYVAHRKTNCGKDNLSSSTSQHNTTTAVSGVLQPGIEEQNDPSLRADDFFSSLELQSSTKVPSLSNKTSGVLTRSKVTAVFKCNTSREICQQQQQEQQQTPRRVFNEDVHVVGDVDLLSAQRSGVESLPKKSNPDVSAHSEDEDDSNDVFGFLAIEFLDRDDHAPPRSHTGGKWKPGGRPMHRSPPSWSRSLSSGHGDDYRGGSWSVILGEESSANPPPTHTGGKWKPQTPTDSAAVNPLDAALNHSDEEDEYVNDDAAGVSSGPPPSHTSGKWAPGRDGRSDANDFLTSPHRKFGNTVHYWCGSCNRRLSSRYLYEKHLKSDLHYKKSFQDRELDVDLEPGDGKVAIETADDRRSRGDGKRIVKRPALYEGPALAAEKGSKENLGDEGSKKKRKSRKQGDDFVACDVCAANVYCRSMGKHLVSRYHCARRRKLNDPANTAMVLANVLGVVKQAPFQCSICKFYCHTIETFHQHWDSQLHKETDEKIDGRYWCSFCGYFCETSSDMRLHFDTEIHKELIRSTNRSVPIVIRKCSLIACMTCDEVFQYNVQLRRHCVATLHPYVHAAEDLLFSCTTCTFRGHSRQSLLRHVQTAHSTKAGYFCSLCQMTFDTAAQSLEHRRSQKHKYKTLEHRKGLGLLAKDLTKSCQYCEKQFGNVLLLKKHLKEEHPENAHRCPHCGKSFTIYQEVSRHVREKACSFFADTSGPSETVAAVHDNDSHLKSPTKSPTTTTVADVTATNDTKCTKCPFTSVSKAELLFHQILHGEPVYALTPADHTKRGTGSKVFQKYPCTFCRKLFRKGNLLNHLSMHVGEHPYVCTICRKSFGYRSSFVSHMKKMHVDRRASSVAVVSGGSDGGVRRCAVVECDFEARSRKAMERHTRRRHSELPKPFQCAVCGNGFRLKHNLMHHMKLHTGKEIKCGECIYECRSRGELRFHVNSVHLRIRPYECATCDYAAKTKAQLTRHQLIHEDSKEHACPRCPFRARMAHHLSRHLRTHSDARPCQCPHCPYTCNLLENLRKHILGSSKHPGKSVYECKFCSLNIDADTAERRPRASFSTNLAKEFKAHLVTAHPESFASTARAASYIASFFNSQKPPSRDDASRVDDASQTAPPHGIAAEGASEHESTSWQVVDDFPDGGEGGFATGAEGGEDDFATGGEGGFVAVSSYEQHGSSEGHDVISIGLQGTIMLPVEKDKDGIVIDIGDD